MEEDLKNAVSKRDSIVVKRLRFVLKILKAITSRPNTSNRGAQAYLFEVLDAIEDWSGNYNEEMVLLLDEQVFPQICTLISTLSKVEFNSLQDFMGKYVLKRWAETSNYAVLDFLCDIYGFITKIAPQYIVEEYIYIFSQDNMPFHVTLMVLPSIFRNLPNEKSSILHRGRLPGVMCLLCVPKEEINDHQKQLVREFWRSLQDSTKNLRQLKKLAVILNQCLVTISYLECLTRSDIIMILQDILDWGSIAGNSENFQVDTFLIISVIFISGCFSTLEETQTQTFYSAMKNLIILVGQNANRSTTKSVRVLTMRIIQKVLERSKKDMKEVLEEFRKIFNVHNHNDEMEMDTSTCNSSFKTEDAVKCLEECAKRISNDPEVYSSSQKRKRLKTLLDEINEGLVTLCRSSASGMSDFSA